MSASGTPCERLRLQLWQLVRLPVVNGCACANDMDMGKDIGMEVDMEITMHIDTVVNQHVDAVVMYTYI